MLTHAGAFILGRTGNAMGSAGADDTSKQGPARRPARLGPRTVGPRNASTASTLEVSEMAKKNKRRHVQVPASPSAASREAGADPPAKLKRKDYERELRRLHGELVAMQEWVKASGAKICIVFEGRDTAGKGGTI
jgi:Polyphosphate kinase 2 (PPK2)